MLDKLFGRYGAETDAAAQSVQRSRLGEQGCKPEQNGALRIMSAGVCGVCFRVGIRMPGDGQPVQFTEDEQFRSDAPCVDVHEKTGNVASKLRLIAELLIFGCQIGGSFPLPKTGFGMREHVVKCALYQRALFFCFCKQLRFVHCVPLLLSCNLSEHVNHIGKVYLAVAVHVRAGRRFTVQYGGKRI